MPSYVYRIKNILNGKQYIGSRKCEGNPKDDLGIKYFSSSRNTEFMKEQKEFPEHFEYLIIQEFENHKDALNKEIELHHFYNVSKNKNFYNLANQTAVGFTTEGLSIPKTEEWKRKISESEKGKVVSQATREKLSKVVFTPERRLHQRLAKLKYINVPVLEFDSSGNFIKEYPNAYCITENKIDESNIIRCCKGISKTCNGKMYKFKTPVKIEKRVISYNKEKLSEIHKKYKNIPILEYNLNGTFSKEYSDLYEIKGNHSNILKCCRNEYKSSNGKIYKFKEKK